VDGIYAPVVPYFSGKHFRSESGRPASDGISGHEMAKRDGTFWC